MFGILGYGYVGKGTHKGLIKDRECVIHDLLLHTDRTILKNSHTVFVCIPTNTNDDINTVIHEIKELKKLNPDVTIVVRSTLSLHSCKRIHDEIGNIIYMPEFLRERYWDTDCLNRPLVVGYDGTDSLPDWLSNEDIIRCTTAEAELIKMFSNNFGVLRIAFANVFYDLAQRMGADYNKVKDTFLKVQHDQTYMEVPGHDGTRGFGGKCLPKDFDFLIETLEDEDPAQNWFKHIKELNKKWQQKF